MTIVPLTKGKTALIDDADDVDVLAHVWRAHRCASKRENWYAYTAIDGRKVYLHRFLMKGAARVDHEDGDGLNNRRHNLRECSLSQNNANSIRTPGILGFTGVESGHHHGGIRYRARIWVMGKRVHVGWFSTAEKAAKARDVAAAAAYGAFARLNFPVAA